MHTIKSGNGEIIKLRKKQIHKKTRAIVTTIPPGNEVYCEYCGGLVKFTAKAKPQRVICNVFRKAVPGEMISVVVRLPGTNDLASEFKKAKGGEEVWVATLEYHFECYREAECPWGEVDDQ